MAGPEQDSGFEVIGDGVIDDRDRRRGPLPSEPAAGAGTGFVEPVSEAAAAAWADALASFRSWWFWLAGAAALGISWGLAAAVVAVGEANGWFETSVPTAVYLLMGAWLSIAAAVLGTLWGFRRPQPRMAGMLLSGLLRGVAFALLSGAVLALVAVAAGGPIALAGAAVVVVAVEVGLFGLMGAGCRACFAHTVPAAVLAGLLLLLLGMGNLAAAVLLLPGTMATGQASVPVNVQRDAAGRITAFECVGQLHTVEVANTDRVAWMAASNPAMIYSALGAGAVPAEDPSAWILSGLQWAADGPQRDVPCLDGESSANLPPSSPVVLTGLMIQGALASLVLIPGRMLSARRR
ncbi:hypothetical protein AAHB33_02695 [Paenarthrobacter sp. S56]|uniref:hypothetical protein n=1 Tax=Paenarthrobacter sp. S56 TaxID=3138179 RepID=UPI00321A4A84